MSELYQLKTTYFCCGLIVDTGRVVEAAPIVKWTVGKKLIDVIRYFASRRVFKSCDRVDNKPMDYFL